MVRLLSILSISIALLTTSASSFAQGFTPFVPPGYPTTAVSHPTRHIKQRGTFVFYITDKGKKKINTIVNRRFGFITPGLFQVFVGKRFGVRSPQPIPGSPYWVAEKVRGRKFKKKHRRAHRKRFIETEQSYKKFSFATNDTWLKYDLLWGVNNNGGFFGFNEKDIDINAPEAWEVTTGDSDMVVGVIDTGVFHMHPDLEENIFRNPLDPVNGIDDDGNGYVDDISGWDFFNEDNNPLDDHYHGTHVAGTIAAIKDNNRGIAGVAPGVKILPLKVLSGDGEGDTSGVVRSIHYAISLKERGINITVLNASLGGGAPTDAMRDALRAANDAGILFVAAAGNSSGNNDVEPIYPASYDIPNVLSVAAMNKQGLLSSFSCYGPTSVDVAAPGEDVWSTIIYSLYLPSGGTSMAAPHVAGVAALVASRYSFMSPSMIKDRIMNTVRPFPDLQGKILSPGLVDAQAAVGG